MIKESCSFHPLDLLHLRLIELPDITEPCRQSNRRQGEADYNVRNVRAIYYEEYGKAVPDEAEKNRGKKTVTLCSA